MKSEKKEKTEKKLKLKNPKGPKVAIEVELELTADGKAKRALEAANLDVEVQELVIEKKRVGDDFAAQIRDRNARVRKLLKEVQTGREMREIQATEVKNFERQVVEYYHKGQVVKSRPLTEQDRQLTFDEASKEKGKKKEEEVKAEAAANPKTAEEKARDNAKACVAVPGKKPPRGERQPIGSDIQDVMRSETNRKTKSSAVDGVLN